MNHLLEPFSFLPNGISLKECLLVFMLIFTRWLVMITLIPFFGAILLPAMVRVAVAFSLSLISFFIAIDHIQHAMTPNVAFIALLFLKEALLGFVIGVLASLLFFAYELFGQFIDSFRGASMSRLLVPELKQQSSPMGAFFFQLALVIFLSLGLHREVIRAIGESFHRFPILQLSLTFEESNLLALVNSILNQLLSTAFKFALPVIFACFLIDVAFGLMNRIAPQINAYFLSLPAKIIGGLIMLLFTLPLLLGDFLEHFHSFYRLLINFLSASPP